MKFTFCVQWVVTGRDNKPVTKVQGSSDGNIYLRHTYSMGKKAGAMCRVTSCAMVNRVGSEDLHRVAVSE